MNYTKVTLSNGEHDELELGPFTQGVVIDSATCQLIDVAASIVVAMLADITGQGARWYNQGSTTPYKQIFIQPYEPARTGGVHFLGKAS